MASIPYEESLCHPLIISRYRTITKAVGGIAHFVTAKKFMGLWPDFRNLGCKKIGSHFRFEGEEYEVDHAPGQSNKLLYLIKNSLTWRNNTKVTTTGTALNILKKVPAFEFEMILC